MKALYPRQPVSGMLIHVHANSLATATGGFPSSAAWPEQIKSLAPIAGSGVTIRNMSVGGRSFETPHAEVPSTLSGTAATEIDAQLSSTLHNVLVVHEFINELKATNISASASLASCIRYCQARRAAADAAGKKLSIVLGTVTPYFTSLGQVEVDRRMNAVIEINNYLRANYRNFADVLWDMAAQEPFRTIINSASGTGWKRSAFEASCVYDPGETTYALHLNPSGYHILAQGAARAVARVRSK